MIRLENVLKMSGRRLQNVLKTSWRWLEDIFQDVLNTLWRCLQDVWPRQIYWSWPRRLEDLFWRRKAKVNIFVLKTKAKDVLKRPSSRWMFAGTVWLESDVQGPILVFLSAYLTSNKASQVNQIWIHHCHIFFTYFFLFKEWYSN